MKTISTYFKVLCAALLITACSNDDAAVTNTTDSYLPLKVNNSWNYDITTGTMTGADVLTVDAVVGTKYTCASNPTPGNGVMTNFLTSGDLEERDGKIILNGFFSLTELGFGDLNIDISNGTLNDQNATNGTETFTLSGTTNETIDNIPIIINYTARNVQRADIPTLSVNGVSYIGVEHSQFIINATILAPFTIAGISQNIPVMRAQDVIVIDNYWAKDVGLVKSENLLSYNLEDFSAFGIVLPIPQSATFTSTQELTSYSLN